MLLSKRRGSARQECDCHDVLPPALHHWPIASAFPFVEHTQFNVALQLLAPSIVPLADTDRALSGKPNPTRRLTVLLGAGASLYAGSPSTDDLTSIVAAREISGAILRALRSRSETSTANFEDVLHVLEELDALLGATRAGAPLMLRSLIEPSDILNGITMDYSLLRRERYELLQAIAVAFNGIDYDSAWRVLYRLLRPLLDDFVVFRACCFGFSIPYDHRLRRR